MKDIAILGAGIAGLTIANELNSLKAKLMQKAADPL